MAEPVDEPVDETSQAEPLLLPLPMFPLGCVLFPHAHLPLHVFEPRYRTLTRDCLRTDREFGVVLIERGSEVGGGDSRSPSRTRLTAPVRTGWLPRPPLPNREGESSFCFIWAVD